MDIITLIIVVATVIPAIYGVIQLVDWFQKRKRFRKRKTTLMLSRDSMQENSGSLKIINFTHPLTSKNLRQIQQLLNQPIGEIVEIKTQLDEDEPFDEQIDKLVNKVGFSSQEWQTGKFLIHLPGFAPAAAALLAELHGRIGHFPAILRLRALPNTTPREFELAEIINLQSTRDSAREQR